jgi:hypothetical protein
MNQYIITEEELDIIRYDCIHESADGCPNDCIYADSDLGCNLDIQDFVDKVRSHPYQSERDKVLDDVLTALGKIKYQEEDIWLFEAIAKKIKELRQAGEP